ISELNEKVKEIDRSLSVFDLFRAMRAKWISCIPESSSNYIQNVGVEAPALSAPPERTKALLKLAKQEGLRWDDPVFHAKYRVVSADDLALVPGLSAETVGSARRAVERGFDMSIMPANTLLPAELMTMKYVPKGDYFVPRATSDEDPYGIFAESIAYTEKVKDAEGNERNIVVFSQKFRDTALVNINSTCCHGCVGCYKSMIAREDPENARKYGLSSEVLMVQMDGLVRELNRRPLVDQVILSGGEPLLYSNSQLKEVLEKLKGIKNLRVLRICTGTLFQGENFRINDELISMLKKFSGETGISVKFNVHLNHPAQITPEAVEAAKRLRDGGISVYAQVPIQAGINFFQEDEERTVSTWVKIVSMVERFGENYKMIVDMHPRTDEYVPSIEQVINVIGRVFGSHEYSDNKLPKTVTVLCRQGNLILDPKLFNSMEKKVDSERRTVTYYWMAEGHSGAWSPVKYVEPMNKYNSDPNSLEKMKCEYKNKLEEAIAIDEASASPAERSKVFKPIGSEWRE
ncbi:MAG: radical SAM protein, partial [Candidatus Micrarchaeota archaeon]